MRGALSLWVGRLLALLMGLGLVALVEGGLRLLPGLAAPSFSVQLAQLEDESLHTLNPAYPHRFFAGAMDQTRLQGMRMAPHPYVQPRGPGEVRVLFVGGSTVQGFPHPRRLAAASYLREMLADAWPGRRVQVFNAGITAISSFAVARTLEDGAVLDPDLVIVYTGHNELYGVYGAASLRQGGEGVWSKHLHYAAMQWRLSALLRRLLGLVRPAEKEAAPGSLLQVMAAAGEVGAGDERRQRAVELLEDNLRAMAAFCRQRGTPLMLCTPASNERGFAPSQGLVRPQVERSRRLLAEDRAGEALQVLEQGGWEDAWALFWKARSLEALGRQAQARALYERARDRDVRPWRASSDLVEAVRRVARTEGVLLADVEASFRRQSPEAGIGWELMADHLHPSAAGQVLLARTLAEALKAAPEEVRVDSLALARLAGDPEYGVRLGDLPVERLAVQQSMGTLLAEKPLDAGNEEQVAHLREQAGALWAALAPGERRGYERWRQGRGRGVLALEAADQLFADGDLARARRHYAAARMEEPYTVWGDVWATLRWGRCLELEGGLSEAEREQLRSLRRRLAFLARSPEFDAGLLDFALGYAAHLLGEDEEALARLQRALQDAGIRRHFAFDLLALLAEELVARERFDEAEGHVRRVTGELGQEEYGRYLLGFIESRRPSPSTMVK